MNVQILGRLSLAAVAAGLALSGSAAAQQPPMPGPEHKVLAMEAGTWDATVEMFMPGAPPTVSKGTEVGTMGCGGLCLITDFKGEFGGMPFHGHGTSTWDPAKKKYVGTWIDSMSSYFSKMEGQKDANGVLVLHWTAPDEKTGKMVPHRSESVETAGTRVMTFFQGKDPGTKTMVIQMKRR